MRNNYRYLLSVESNRSGSLRFLGSGFYLKASLIFVLSILCLGNRDVFAQSAGFNNTFLILSLNGGANAYYDLNAATSNTDFNNANLGTFAAGSTNLTLKGAEHNVFKCGGADLTSTRLYYRVYPTASPNGSFISQSIGFTSGFNNGCGGQDQVWSNTGLTINVLAGLGAGAYTLEVFSDATITCCGGTAFASNSGNNYKANFTVSSILWTNSGALTDWYTNTNWTPNTASGAWLTGSVAEFQNSGSATTAGINMGTASLSIGQIDVTSARTRALTIGNSSATAGTLTLNGATAGSNANVILRNSSGSLLTLQNTTGSMTIALGNTTTNTIDAAGTGGIAISSVISGTSRSITKIGSGVLTLSGANTYTGATTISEGILRLGNASALGTVAAGTSIISGAALDLNGTNYSNLEALTANGTGISNGGAIINSSGTAATFSGAIALGTNSTIGGSGNITLSGVVSGGFTLTKTGANTLTLSSATSSYSGGTFIRQGTVSVINAGNLGNATGAVTIGDGANSSVLSIGATFARTALNVTDLSTAGVINVGNTFTFTLTNLNGAGSNTTKFGKDGPGTLTLSGAGTYPGQIQIGNGSVIVSNNAGLGTNISTANRGIDLGLNVGDVSQPNNVSVLATTNITVPQSIYVAPNSSGATRTVGVSGATVSATFSNEIYLDGTLTAAAGTGNTLILNGRLTNIGGLNVSTGTTVLSNTSNNYSGATTISTNGTLRLGGIGVIPDASNVTLSGGTLSTGSPGAGNNETAGILTLSANSVITLGNGDHNLYFAASNGSVWTAGATLTITNWSGSAGSSGTSGKIFFGTDASGLTAAQLSAISFTGFLGTPILLSTGELVPPSTFWDANAATSGSGNSGGNWSDAKWTRSQSGLVPTTTFPAGTTPTFSASSDGTAALTINVDAAVSARGLIFEEGAITLSNGSGSITLTDPLLFVNPAVASGVTNLTTIEVPLAGSVGLTKAGLQTLLLSGNNSYTGATNVVSGTLRISNPSALGSAAQGTTVVSTAALEIQNATFQPEPLNISGTGVSNNGALRFLSGTTVWTGPITLGLAARINAETGVNSIDVASGSAISGAFALTVGGAGNLTIADPIATGAGTLTKDQAGTLTLSAANTYTGATIISGGVLQLGAAGVIADVSSVTLGGGTIMTGAAAGFSETVGALTLSASSSIVLGSGVHTLTFANSSAATWTAGATITITGWTGTPGASGTSGRVFFGNSAAGLTADQLARITFAGQAGTPVLLSTGELVPAGFYWDANGATAGSGNAGGSWSAANWTTAAAGDVATTAFSGTRNPVFSAGTDGTGSFTIVNDVAVSANGLTFEEGNVTISDGPGTLTLVNPYISVGSAATGVIVEPVLGTAGLIKTGTGLLTLSGTGTYTGVTTVSAGSLRITNASALGSSAPAFNGARINAGASLEMANAGSISDSLFLSGTGISNGGALRFISGTNTCGRASRLTAASRINADAGTNAIDVASGSAITGTFALTIGGAGNLTIADPIATGTGTLTKDGSGVLTLSAVNTFTGAISVNEGTLQLGAADVIPTGSFTLGGGTLRTGATTGFKDSLGALTVSAASVIALGTGAHTLKFASSAAAWPGTLIITGWTGTGGAAGTGGRIIFTSTTNVTPTILAKISFAGYPGTPVLIGGEIVPPVTPVDYTWNGSVSNAWGTAANWTPAGPPLAKDNVTLGGGNIRLSLNATSVSVNNLTINGDNFEIIGSSMTVTGNLIYTSGSPNFDCGSTLNIISGSSQTIPALQYGNLNISGGPRVLASSGTIGICGNFTPSEGATTTGSTVLFNPPASAVRTINGSGNINNATFSATGASASWSLAANTALSIEGDLSIVNGTLNVGTASAGTLSVAGNFSISGGTLTASSGAGAGTINLSGNFSQTGGTIQSTGASSINFIKANGIQTVFQNGGTNFTNITVGFGSGTSTNTVRLLTNLYSTTAGAFLVRTLGTLDFQTFNISSSGAATFATQANSTLISANTSASGAFNLGTGELGSIQVGGTRTIDAGTNLIFNGASDQYVGFTSQATARAIRSLTINTSNGAKVMFNPSLISLDFTIDSTLTLTSGVFSIMAGRIYVRKDVVGNPGFSTSNMIVTNQGSVFPQRNQGQFRRFLPNASPGATQTVRMLMPMGDIEGTAEYTPSILDVTYTAGPFTVASPYIGFKCIDNRNPYDASLTDYMTRYWILTTGTAFNNASSTTLNVRATYKNADVVGNEAALKMNRFNTATLQNTEDITSYTDPANDTLYSAALDRTMFTDHDILARKTVSLYYRSNTIAGSWRNENNWLISSDVNFVSPAGVPAPIPPNSANSDSITIMDGHSIAADTIFPPFYIDQARIDGNLSVIAAPTPNLIFGNGPGSLDVLVNGTLTIAGTQLQAAGSVLKFGSTGTYVHASSVSTAKIPTAIWDPGSTCRVTGVTSSIFDVSSLLQPFSDFVWDCPGQAASVNLLTSLRNVGRDFKVISTGTPTSYNLGLAGSAGSYTMNIGRNLEISGGSLVLTTGAVGPEINVSGDLVVSSGVLDVNSGFFNPSNLNLYGNFIQSGGNITRTQGTSNLNFVRSSGIQTISQSGGLIINTVNFNIGNGSTTSNTVQLLTNMVNGTGTITAQSGATLDFQTFSLTGSGTFTAASGTTLRTANTNPAGAFVTSGANGSVQTSTRIFSQSGVNYIFNGASAQTGGNGLGVSAINNLTVDNAAGLSLSSPLTINGTTSFTSGLITLGSSDVTLGGSATVSNQASGRYFRTNGSGRLKRTVASSAVDFPVGNSAYNPVQMTNAGTSDVLGVRVLDDISTPAPNVPAKAVNRYWQVTEDVSGGSDLAITAQFNMGEEGAAFNAGTQAVMGLYSSSGTSWNVQNAARSGTGPFTFTASFPAVSGNSYHIGIGVDNALHCPSPPSISSFTPSSGFAGETISISGTGLSGITSVTLGGSAAQVNSQSGTSASITIQQGSSGTLFIGTSEGCGAVSSSSFSFLGYRSAQTGNWGTASTWQGNVLPTSAQPVTILNGHNVSSDVPAAPSAITVDAGGTLTLSNAARLGSASMTASINGNLICPSAVAGTSAGLQASGLTIGNGGIFTNSASNASGITVNSFSLNAGSTYNHDATGSGTAGSTSDFPGLSNGANITINSAASVNFTKWGVSGQNPPSFPVVSGGQWGNLTINISGQTLAGSIPVSGAVANASSLNIQATGTRDFRLAGASSSYTGNFGSIQVSGGTLALCAGGSSGSGNAVLNVSGATSISGGVMSVHGSAASNDFNSGTVTANFNGNFSMTGGTFYGLASNSTGITYSSGNTAINFNADVSIGPGNFDLAYLPSYVSPSAATGPVAVNLKGNLNLMAGGTISSSNSLSAGRATASSINFNKATGSQTFSDAGTISSHAISWSVSGAANTLSMSSSADLGGLAGSSFSVNSGSTLNCGSHVLSGGGSFSAQAGSTVRIGSSDGISSSAASGNIQFGTRNFNSAANYTYIGTGSQSTGNGLPATITGNLTIANTGATGDNTVTLSTNNTTVSALNLNSGLFAAGTGQNLNLANAGVLNATGGDFVSGAAAGTITATGSAAFNGTSNPYNVYTSGGLNFGGQTVTIQSGGTFRINSGGFVNINAPSYAAGSTLEYNVSGVYNRNLEWFSSSGRGAPHHVLISSGTLNPAGAGASRADTVLNVKGNLTISSGGSLYMNYAGNNMQKPLNVAGNLLLSGNLSGSDVIGGDINVGGNWTNNGTAANFFPNNRQVSFNGSIAQTIGGSNNPFPAFDYLAISNTGGNVSSSRNLVINQRLQTNNGKLIMGDTVTLGASALIEEDFANGSYTIGVVRTTRTVNTAAATFGGIGVDLSAGDNLGVVTVIRSSGAAGLLTELPATPDSSIRWNWIITPSVQPSPESPNRDLTLSWPAAEDNNRDLSNLQIWKRSTSSDPWEEAGAIQAAGGNSTVRSVVWNNVNGFSQFTVGENNVPLALDLLSFGAVKEKNHVRISWKVADDARARVYVLEKSVDNGVSYSSIESRAAGAKGGEYTAYDYRFSVDSYYRVRVLYNDGKEDLSSSVFVKTSVESVRFNLLPCPAPAGKGVRIEGFHSDDDAQHHLVQVMNSEGKLCLKVSSESTDLNQKLEAGTALLPAGLYQVRISSAYEVQTLRFVKE